MTLDKADQEALAFLDLLMKLAREHGARVVDFKGIRVEMEGSAPERGPLVPRDMLAGAAGEPEKCACSHDETTHDPDGLCLLGCAEHVCRRTTPESANGP